MRWNVEVSSIDGSKPAQSYVVEAETWQGALQGARRLRGDESRMAGFSIDITNDGCRAVDPAKKLRYTVARTTDDAPLTPGGEAQPSSKRQGRVSNRPPKVEPTTAAKPAPPRPASVPPPRPAAAPAAVAVPPAAPVPVVAPQPAPPPAAPPIPPIVVKREQEATAEVPLTYREYGFALPPGTSEEIAAAALRELLVQIQAAIAPAPPGKLVNLAAFDVHFQGRPTVLPLATLTWKDWRPEPTIAFPRRARPAPAPAPAPAPVAAPVPPPEPVFPVAVAVVPTAAPVSQTRPVPPPPAPAQKPPLPKRRVRGDELISVLFESMHDLHFLRDSIEGGDFCLQLATEKLPSRMGLVYLYDIDRREFVVVAAIGNAPANVVGRRVAETEGLMAAATRKRRAIVLGQNDPAKSEHAPLLGDARDVLLAPVMQAGRYLGAIELADPTDGVPFSELDANAISYMAEQYAEFVAARGVLLDRERSSQPPAVHQ